MSEKRDITSIQDLSKGIRRKIDKKTGRETTEEIVDYCPHCGQPNGTRFDILRGMVISERCGCN
jgi:hypothetical protein